jgi:glycosyltransferase involved in cell wall biosynthesis
MKPKTNIAVDFSIIIPAYNEQNYIGAVLERLFNAIAEIENLTGEVIVVDNNCSDQTAILAKEKGARVVF